MTRTVALMKTQGLVVNEVDPGEEKQALRSERSYSMRCLIVKKMKLMDFYRQNRDLELQKMEEAYSELSWKLLLPKALTQCVIGDN